MHHKNIKTSFLESHLIEQNSILQEQHDSRLQRIHRIVSWRETPAFPRIGRCAFAPLESPMILDDRGNEVHSLKLKGTGLLDHKGKISHPTTDCLRRVNPHLGFRDDGKFISIESAPAPIGGIVFERAKAEYEIAKALYEQNCPAIYPVQLYCYEDIAFEAPGGERQPMGVVVTGFPQANALRADAAFNYEHLGNEAQEMLKSWMSHLGVSGARHLPLALICALSAGFGQTLREFGAAGFYRYAGVPDNYAYNPTLDRVYLIDLDSSRPLAECSYLAKPLQLIRDVASGIAYLIGFLTHPRTIENFNPESVRDFNPFTSLLQGYYSELDDSFIEEVAEILYRLYLQNHAAALEYAIENPHRARFNRTGIYASHGFQEFWSTYVPHYWVSRKKNFAWAFGVAWLLHERSALQDVVPLQHKRGFLYNNVREYCSLNAAEELSYHLERFTTVESDVVVA